MAETETEREEERKSIFNFISFDLVSLVSWQLSYSLFFSISPFLPLSALSSDDDHFVSVWFEAVEFFLFSFNSASES